MHCTLFRPGIGDNNVHGPVIELNHRDRRTMAMNKKHKKQLDLARKKLTSLQQLLAAARKQLDDPKEVRDLERQIKTVEEQIEKIQAS
jgi:hypothetical protein